MLTRKSRITNQRRWILMKLSLLSNLSVTDASHMANVTLPGLRLRPAVHRSTRFLFSHQARSIIPLPGSSLKEDYIPENKKRARNFKRMNCGYNLCGRSAKTFRFLNLPYTFFSSPATGILTVMQRYLRFLTNLKT